MLTWRNVFSSSLVNSAARVVLTGTVSSTSAPVERLDRRQAGRRQAGTTFGVVASVHSRLPGSMRSGE